ncbi:MAG: N-6 DNA methylase, partial [Candidatus Cloacimonetes bacterium]|nr:N-6 DNA methylase [Candidatus Cloacimonadota bacterium]
KVADICSGSGTFLINASLNVPDATYRGVEINTEMCSVSRAKTEYVSGNIEIEQKDAFFLLKENPVENYSKIFSNYPFGLRMKNLNEASHIIEEMMIKYPGASKATSSDWLFNVLLMNLLSKNGKAVSIMTNGSTWNELDTGMRKSFVENGYIESIILLPAKMFQFTSIPTTMIVLSHNNTSGVRIVDTTKHCIEGRRINEFSKQNIEEILNSLSDDTDYSRFISLKELRENNYSLSLNRYLSQEVNVSYPVQFAEAIKKITRGAQLSAAQLDQLVSDAPTDVQYLMLANIKDGIIGDDLPYLQAFDEKLEKYCIKSNNLIISKNGYPYKVAVASVKERTRIIGNGNMYIIELDEEKANPYYIKAFFESEQGIAALKSITVGATIQSIGVDSLKKLIIPLPPIEDQMKIAERYQVTLDEILLLQLKIERAKSRLKNAFDEEVRIDV